MYVFAFGQYTGCLIQILTQLAVGPSDFGASIFHWWLRLWPIGY